MSHSTTSATEMLQKVSSETAQQLFNAIRYRTDPPGSTMLPELDEHILGTYEDPPSMNSSLNRGDVIEVQGPAASGKTQLLYHLAACCIMPDEILVISANSHAERTVQLGGWYKSAVVFDCDGRWNIRRLYQILATRLNLAFSKAQLPPLPHKSHTTVHSIAHESLSRLHVFRPTSSFQLAATLLNLPRYHAEQMPDEEIRLLFVDSISSFYWTDRWQAEPSGSKNVHRSNPLGHVLRCLQAFRLSHGPVTVLTNWGVNPLPSSALASSTPFFKQHLPSPFPAPFDNPPRRIYSGHSNPLPLTCHITLPFAFISQLQLDLSDLDNISGHEGGGIEEALRDRRREEIVRRGEIGGYVRIPRNPRGQDSDLPNTVGKFRFRVLEGDVVAGTSTWVNCNARLRG